MIESLYLDEFEKNEEKELPVINNVVKSVNRYKSRNRPKNPKDLNFNIEDFATCYIPRCSSSLLSTFFQFMVL